MRFTLWIVQPRLDPHCRPFIEICNGFKYSLEQLGHEVAFDPGKDAQIHNPLPDENGDYGQLIVFNANRLPAVPLPKSAILYNAEQVQKDGEMGAAWQSSWYIQALRRHMVWDYSDLNIENLRGLGVERVAKCGVGFYPGLVDLPPVTESYEYDVLFVGSTNDRRVKLLQECAKSGLRTRSLYAVYGEERNRIMARSKIILNVHFYPQPVFEIFRVSHAVANAKCVVSEDNGLDPQLESLAKELTAYVPYGDIVKTCWQLCNDDAARKVQEQKGFEAFRKVSQVELVRDALESSGLGAGLGK